MKDETRDELTPWERIGGVLAVVAVLIGALLVVTRGPQGPATSGAAVVPPAVRPAPAAERPGGVDLHEGGADEPATRRPDATQGITAPNARQWLAARAVGER